MRFFYAMAVLATTTLAAMTMFSRNSEQDKGSAEKAPSSAPSKAAALPKDIYPDTMARLPVINREEMDEHGKKVYDLFAGPQVRSVTGVRGPYGMWLYSVPIAERAQALNYHMRYELSFGRRLTELGILVASRELDSQFEWTAHEPLALKEGLEQQIIDTVKYRKSVAGLGEKEAVIITFGRELMGKRKVSSQTFANALKLFGKQGVVELAALMGDYASVNATIVAFDMHLQPGQKPLLPIP
jgi:4-carboxymuconolactone decarboxylase